MHFRRLACVALGSWLAGSALLLALASYNLRTIEPLVRLPSKAAAETMVRVQDSDARVLMRYHADDVNRWAWGSWEIARFVLGLVVPLSLFLSVGGKRCSMLICVLMLGVAAFQHWM